MLKTIINFWWRIWYGEWSDARVKAYFDRFRNIFELRQALENEGFQWQSDGLNFSIQTDTFERPGQVLARKWANCGGFMRLFEAYIKYKNDGVIFYEQFEMSTRDRKKWHYVMLFQIEDGRYYLQTNNDIFQCAGDTMITLIFPDYDQGQKIDEWRKN